MNPILTDLVGSPQPIRCPKCGNILDCFFHERDSTSDRMNCPVCNWWAGVAWDGEWLCADDTYNAT